MRIGILSDVHANLEAAEKSIAFLKGKVDFIASLGDVVGYGPEPEECVDLIEENCSLIVRGNHEEAILSGNFSRLKTTARQSLLWTEKNLSPAYIERIKKWPVSEEREGCFFAHASVSDPLFKYLVRKEDAEEEFKKLETSVCFVGHTHIPGGFQKSDKTGLVDVIYSDFGGEMKLLLNRRFIYILNVGSVGQPRDGLPFSCTAIYDGPGKQFSLSRIEYPLELTRQKILEKGLPSVLAKRVMQGI